MSAAEEVDVAGAVDAASKSKAPEEIKPPNSSVRWLFYFHTRSCSTFAASASPSEAASGQITIAGKTPPDCKSGEA